MWESVQFILQGFLFVMVVLAILGLLTSAIGMIFKRLEPKPAPKPVAQPVATPAPQTEENPHLPAVIAAAVYAMLGEQPHRIVEIRPTDEGWAREGRRSLLGSHKVR